MTGIMGIDHVAITVADLDASCAFYDRLFGTRVAAEYSSGATVLVRQIMVGAALLSIHQQGNGVSLVARTPTVGAADVCFRWRGTIATAMARLEECKVPIVEGPSPRRTADDRPSQSVYFRDPDGNLLELMAADP